MSIELHCPQCQRLIRAPDDAGGKRGRCPYCKNSVYIPTPPDEGEDIALAPLDEEAEKNAESLRRDAIQFAALLDRATEGVPEGNESAPADAGVLPPGALDVPTDVGGDVEAFIVAMRDSELELADAAVARLKRAGANGRDAVQRLLADPIPPSFQDVPPPVVKGFLKTLLGRLS